MFKTCIYSIQSPSGNFYIGSAVNFSQRKGRHLFDLRRNNHHSRALQSAYNKYGEASLIFKQIIICAKENLLMYEQLAMDAIKPLYNCCKTAGSRLGVKNTKEAIEKIKQTMATKESKELRSKLFIGRVVSDETREKQRKAHTGAKRTPEAIAKSAKSRTGLKRTLTEDARNNIIASNKNRVISEDDKLRISLARKERGISDETRLKMRSAKLGKAGVRKGIGFTDECKKRISDGVKKYYRDRNKGNLL